jgi:hypothetical protein
MSKPNTKTVSQLEAELRAAPGIDITKLPLNSKLIVETTAAVYEFSILNPTQGLVSVTSVDSRFAKGSVCRIERSTYDLEGKVSVPYWVGKHLRMQLTFKNGILPCAIAVSARIEGDGWHYNVF